jgi:hypothetical protein
MSAKTQHVVKTPQGKQYVPGVRIAGKYLTELNFNINDEVQILTAPECIVITKVDVLQRMQIKNPALTNLIEKFGFELE